MRAFYLRTQAVAEMLRRFPYYIRLGRRRSDTDAASRHLARAVHPEFVENPRAGPQIRGQAFRESRHVEEDVSATVIGTQESEPFGFEVRDYAARLFAHRRFAAGVAGFGSALRPAGFIADALLNQSQVGFRPICGGLRFGGNLEIRIALPSLLK